MKYKIDSKHPLRSDWLHFKVFDHNNKAADMAIAVELVNVSILDD